MAYADYCPCKVCESKSFYDASMNFEDVWVDGKAKYLPVRCGDYAGLCEDCAKTHTLEAVKRDKPVKVEFDD